MRLFCHRRLLVGPGKPLQAQAALGCNVGKSQLVKIIRSDTSSLFRRSADTSEGQDRPPAPENVPTYSDVDISPWDDRLGIYGVHEDALRRECQYRAFPPSVLPMQEDKRSEAKARSESLQQLSDIMADWTKALSVEMFFVEAEMEVSQRSLYRNSDSLRAAGSRFDGEGGYGYHLIEANAMSPQAFTRDEIEVIALGLAEVKAIGNPSMTATADAVLSNIVASMPDGGEQPLFHAVSRVYRPGRKALASPFTGVVRDACRQEDALTVRHADECGATGCRTIRPLAIVRTGQRLVALVRCCLRNEFRKFRLDRLQAVEKAVQWFRPCSAFFVADLS